MHEFIRPVAGAIALRALMGVRSLWPYNAIGLGGLVVGQAFKQRSVPTSHQIHLAFGCRLAWVAVSPRSRGHIFFFSGQQDPGDPRSLVGERDKRAIEPSPGRHFLEPLGAPIIVFRQSAHYRACAVDHLSPQVMVGASANTAEPRLSAGCILSWRQADPCGKLPS